MTFPVEKLLEICSVRTGKRDANHGDLGGPYPFFTCAAEPIESPTYSFDGDSIILPGNGANVGLVIFYSGKFEAYQRTYVLSGFNCDARYAYHHLRCFWSRANGSSQYGSATNYIRMGNFEDYTLPIPPLTEQRRIAEVLDRAEALRAKRRAALAQLDSLTQSLFLDLFGDTRKERTRWPTVPLEGIVKETKLGLVRGSQEFGPEFPIPYVRMNAITRSGALELGNVQRTHATEAEVEAYRLEPGDFLFNTRNSEELVGKTALYRGGGLHLFNNNLMRVRFTARADPIFIAAAFKTAFVQHELNLRKSGTTNVFAIYYKDLRSLPLPLPPIPLQREFARRVTAVEALKTAQRASLAELDALFATLQHRAFKGEL